MVVWLLWLSDKVQKPGVLGAILSNCRPLHFLPHNSLMLMPENELTYNGMCSFTYRPTRLEVGMGLNSRGEGQW